MFTVHLLGSSDNRVLLQHLCHHSCPSSRLPPVGSTLLRFAEQIHGVPVQHHPWAFLSVVSWMDSAAVCWVPCVCTPSSAGSSGQVHGSRGALLALHIHYCFLSVSWSASGWLPVASWCPVKLTQTGDFVPQCPAVISSFASHSQFGE